jgi:hypothetical protein
VPADDRDLVEDQVAARRPSEPVRGHGEVAIGMGIVIGRLAPIEGRRTM